VLSVLALRNNELRDGTANELLAALEKNTTVSDIDISCNDFGFDALVRLKRTIEEHKRELNSNIAEVATKHVNFLKGEEQTLQRMSGERKMKEKELADRNTEKASLLQDVIDHESRYAQMLAEAEKSLEDLQAQYDEAVEKRRQRLRECHQTKMNLERKENDAQNELQRLITTRHQVQARVQRTEAKKLDEATKSSKALGDLKIRIEEAQMRLKVAVEDVVAAKAQMLEEEARAREAAMAAEGNSEENAVPKGKQKGKGKSKGRAKEPPPAAPPASLATVLAPDEPLQPPGSPSSSSSSMVPAATLLD
jgi:chromosome segregation ATPase